MTEPEVTFTDRGFALYGTGVDMRGTQWRIQESSIAGDPHCWLFTDANPSQPRHGSLHLHYNHVVILVGQLHQALAEESAPDRVFGEGTCRYGIAWKVYLHRFARRATRKDVSNDVRRVGLTLKGVMSGGGSLEERIVDDRLVLSPEQLKALRSQLELFLRHSSSPEHWKNSPDYMTNWRSEEGLDA